ncbi:MAG: hypothetical protein ACHQ7N_19340 [Candidatus Methylomirabilales bacterium]
MVRRLEAQPQPKPSWIGTEFNVGEELAKITDEPFLPVERQLVTWSLILGLALLGALIWVSERFFTG